MQEIKNIDSSKLKEVVYNGELYIQYIQKPNEITVGDFSILKKEWDVYNNK